MPMVTFRWGCSSPQVAVTVVSVGPYAFRMRRPGLDQRFTSPAGHASPLTNRLRSAGSSPSRVVSSVGTQHSTVMACSSRNSASPRPTLRSSPGPATRVAPAIQAGQISSIEKSKAMESPW